MAGTFVITPFEAEAYIRQLEPLGIDRIGDSRWLEQHEQLEKLNMQAHSSAGSRHDEFVVDLFESEEKVGVLVHELLAIELWKQKVFPLLKGELHENASIKAYMVLYHEATICNLLEVLLYHSSTVESLANGAGSTDALIELIDYCYRQFAKLNARSVNPNFDQRSDVTDETVSESLTRQAQQIEFSVCAIAVAMFRFVTDHMSSVPIGVLARILHTSDMVLSLIPLVVDSPWTRTSSTSGELEKFVNQRWEVVPSENRMKLSQLEAQAWLCVYNLLMDTECRKKYEITSHRKDSIMQLKGLFSLTLTAQLPLLSELHRFTEELSLMVPIDDMSAGTENTPFSVTQGGNIGASSRLILELVPEMRESMLSRPETEWKSLAKEQLDTVFSSDESSRREEIARFASTFGIDQLDELLLNNGDEPKCGKCGNRAEKRCSRCRNEWYCGRECQVSAWDGHRKVCDVLASA